MAQLVNINKRGYISAELIKSMVDDSVKFLYIYRSPEITNLLRAD